MMAENSGIDVDMNALDAREVPHPPHSWATAQRSIQTACDAGEHDWVELTGFEETRYWRECRDCGIADVTAAAVGQDVATPNANQQEDQDR
jgi:hypothetical protein